MSVSESGGSFGSGRRWFDDDRVTSLTTVGRCQQEGKPPPSNKGIKKSGSLLECVTPMQVRIHYLLGRIIAIGYSYMYSIQR